MSTNSPPNQWGRDNSRQHSRPTAPNSHNQSHSFKPDRTNMQPPSSHQTSNQKCNLLAASKDKHVISGEPTLYDSRAQVPAASAGSATKKHQNSKKAVPLDRRLELLTELHKLQTQCMKSIEDNAAKCSDISNKDKTKRSTAGGGDASTIPGLSLVDSDAPVWIKQNTGLPSYTSSRSSVGQYYSLANERPISWADNCHSDMEYKHDMSRQSSDASQQPGRGLPSPPHELERDNHSFDTGLPPPTSNRGSDGQYYSLANERPTSWTDNHRSDMEYKLDDTSRQPLDDSQQLTHSLSRRPHELEKHIEVDGSTKMTFAQYELCFGITKDNEAGESVASTSSDSFSGSLTSAAAYRTNSTPLTGAAALHGAPKDEETESVLKLPISPRELAYAQLLEQSRLAQEIHPVPVARYRGAGYSYGYEDKVGPPPHRRLGSHEDSGLHASSSVNEFGYLDDREATPLPEKRRYTPSHDDFNRGRRGTSRPGCGATPLMDWKPPPDFRSRRGAERTHGPPKRPAGSEVEASEPKQKKTWPKDGERAPITEDLLPYVGMIRCDICSVEYNHPISAKAHLIGRAHIKKLKQMGLPLPDHCIDKTKPDWKAKVAQFNKSTPESLGVVGTKLNSEGVWPDWMEEKFQDDFCGICNVPLTSLVTAETHYDGKKHLKKCNAYFFTHEGEAVPGLDSQFHCRICHIYCQTAEIMAQHEMGQKHLQTARWHRTVNDKPHVSEVREREVDVDIVTEDALDAEAKKKKAEEAANDFFAMAAKMNGL